MNLRARKVLFINLAEKKSEVKSFEDYGKYIGGVGLGAKVLSESDKEGSVVFSVGPLNGFFPCVSKTSVLFKYNGKVQDIYLGGNLSSRIKFTGIDSIVLQGKSEDPVRLEIIDEDVSFKDIEAGKLDSLGLPGKRSTLVVNESGLTLDQYFEAPNDFLSKKLSEMNIETISVTGTKTFDIENKERYEELDFNLLERCKKLTVEETGDPSCFGCPLGCGQAKVGEEDGDVLLHSLVSCTYTKEIYSDVSTVFSCLDVLDYKYVHEDLENFPNVVYDLIKELESNE